MLRRIWPVYAHALHDTFVAAISTEEAALITAALNRITEPPREQARSARKSATPRRPNRG